MELCWLSCVSSELNGAELTRSGGVDILGALLARCCSVMPQDVAPNQASAVIATHCLHTLAGMAIFANAKSELVSRWVVIDSCSHSALSCRGSSPCARPVHSSRLLWLARPSLYR